MNLWVVTSVLLAVGHLVAARVAYLQNKIILKQQRRIAELKAGHG